MKWNWPERAAQCRALLEKYRVVLAVLAAGLLLMLLPTGKQAAVQARAAPEQTAAEDFKLEEFEQRLAHALSQVEGAGETTVLLTLKSGSQQVLARDLERDGERTVSTAVTVGGGSTQAVVPLQTLSPQFRGALVICPGGEDPQVRLRLAQAVTALTGLSSDHISICKRT